LVIGMQVIDIRKIGSIDLLSTLKSGFWNPTSSTGYIHVYQNSQKRVTTEPAENTVIAFSCRNPNALK
jgi:hypothetical protein